MTTEDACAEVATLRLPARLAPGVLGTILDADGNFIARAAGRELGQAIVDALNGQGATIERRVRAKLVEDLRAEQIHKILCEDDLGEPVHASWCPGCRAMRIARGDA